MTSPQGRNSISSDDNSIQPGGGQQVGLSSPLHSPGSGGGSPEYRNFKLEKVGYAGPETVIESVNSGDSQDGLEVQSEIAPIDDSNIIITTIDNPDIQQSYTIGSPGSDNYMLSPTGGVDVSDQPLIVVTGGHPQSNNQQIEIGEVQSDHMLCMVCTDKGSGYHYSVYSCEGCKGFFKRSVQKNLNYMCKESKMCVVNKYTRNNCQYCRFMKCLEAGMKREAVREDRTPGGGRHGKGGGGGKRPRLEDDPNIISTIVSSVATDPADEVMIQRLVDAKPDLIPCASDIVSEDSSSAVDINSLMQYGYMELRLIIEWARKVPGFPDLLIEDQMALLKGSFMELNVLRLSYRSLNCEGGVKFAQGLILTPEQSTDIGWGHDLTNCSLEFISKLKEIFMDNTEFCILNAIVLTYPDATGVRDKDSVIKLQSTILDNLRKYTVNKYPDEPRRYGKMLLRLPALRTVSAIAAERFLSMSLDGNIRMNALVLEMMS